MILPPETHDQLVREQHGKDIAFRIRAELVCCNIYAQVNDTHELTIRQAMDSRDWHDLCYWGEASARIAEGECPGYETEPNICVCKCEGCTYNCRAHHSPDHTPSAPASSPEPDPVEPDNPEAWALARHIADHRLSTFQAAMRYLNSQVVIEVQETNDCEWNHTYLSTSCLHAHHDDRPELHDYCQNKNGMVGPKKPGLCKFCDGQCICSCHQTEGE